MDQLIPISRIGYDESLSWVENLKILVPQFSALPDSEIQFPILLSSLCCYSKYAKKLPCLGLIGETSTGKSQLSKLVKTLFDSPKASELTLPGIKRTLNSSQVLRKNGSPVLDSSGKPERKHLVLCLEEVSPAKLHPSSALYSFFKNSRDKETSEMSQASIMSDDEDSVKSYNVFCLLVITSIHPFFSSAEYSEMERRTLWFHFEANNDGHFINSGDYDFSPLLDKFYLEWIPARDKFIELLVKRRPNGMKSLQWDRFQTSLCSGVAMGLFTWKQGLEAIEAYLSYREEKFPQVQNDPLYNFLHKDLEGSSTVDPETIKTRLTHLCRLGIIPIDKIKNDHLQSTMIRLGYKLEVKPVKDFFSEGMGDSYEWVKTAIK